ncbi:unnamed protein product [Lota lota]
MELHPDPPCLKMSPPPQRALPSHCIALCMCNVRSCIAAPGLLTPLSSRHTVSLCVSVLRPLTCCLVPAGPLLPVSVYMYCKCAVLLLFMWQPSTARTMFQMLRGGLPWLVFRLMFFFLHHIV